MLYNTITKEPWNIPYTHTQPSAKWLSPFFSPESKSWHSQI